MVRQCKGSAAPIFYIYTLIIKKTYHHTNKENAIFIWFFAHFTLSLHRRNMQLKIIKSLRYEGLF